MSDRLGIIVDVPDTASGDTSRRRIAGLLDDRETLFVAAMIAGADQASIELTAKLAELQQLAEDVLSGEPRAKTAPGLARKLSAFALVLFRVCHAANAFNTIGGFDDGRLDHSDDREPAAADENSGD